MFGIHGFMHIYAAGVPTNLFSVEKNDIKFDCKARTRDRFAFRTNETGRFRSESLIGCVVVVQ